MLLHIFSFQGQAIFSPTKMVLDVSSCFEPAQAYVMMSRVQSLEQVYILNKLDVDKISISGQALDELERLEAISFNRNLTPWYDDDCFHVSSLNCAGLISHIQDIRRDEKLLLADLILLQEISMDTKREDDCQLQGFEASFICCGRGKGIASYMKDGSVFLSFRDDSFQVSSLSINGVHCFNVYRSQEGSITRLIKRLDEEVDVG